MVRCSTWNITFFSLVYACVDAGIGSSREESCALMRPAIDPSPTPNRYNPVIPPNNQWRPKSRDPTGPPAVGTQKESVCRSYGSREAPPQSAGVAWPLTQLSMQAAERNGGASRWERQTDHIGNGHVRP